LQTNPLYVHLPEGERQGLRENLSELFYLLTEAERKRALAGTPPDARSDLMRMALHWNDQAIHLSDPSRVPRALVQQRARLEALLKSEKHSGDGPLEEGPSTEFGGPGPSSRAETSATVLLENSISSLPLMSAIEALHGGQFRQALTLLEAARRKYPLSYSTWLLLGNAHVGLGQYSEADHCYTTAAALWKTSLVPYWLRGLERLECHRQAEAISDFNEVLARKPNDPGALLNRAVARYELKDYRGAEEDLTAALDHGAPQTRLFFLRARVRQQLGKFADAASDKRQGLSREPTDERSWVARGMARLPDDVAGALADFQEACRRYPNSRAALRNVAFVLGERMGNTQQALAYLNRLVDVDDPLAEDIVARGVYHARLGNRAAALADARRALAGSAGDKTKYQVACIYGLTSQFEAADVDSAISYLGQALAMNRTRWLALARNDPDLELPRKDRRFDELIRAAETFQRNMNGAEVTE
jgi:tetratricopeptide (TPR) repeat protein